MYHIHPGSAYLPIKLFNLDCKPYNLCFVVLPSQQVTQDINHILLRVLLN